MRVTTIKDRRLCGFEVEFPLYNAEKLLGKDNSTPVAEIIPAAKEIVAQLPKITSTEPLGAFLEYKTAACSNFSDLVRNSANQIKKLSLKMLEFGIVPGCSGTIPDKGTNCLTDSSNPYYIFIQKKWNESVSTGGVHLNVGSNSDQELFDIWPFLRVLSSLNLGFTSSSTALRGEPRYIGKEGHFNHSYRQLIFPQFPKESEMPFFKDKNQFVDWFNKRIKNLKSQTEYKDVNEKYLARLLWNSVRPNGDNRPFDLNRLEGRTSDNTYLSLIHSSMAFQLCLTEFLSQNMNSLKNFRPQQKDLDNLEINLLQVGLNGLDGKFENTFNYIFNKDVKTHRQALKVLLENYLLPISEKLGLREQLQLLVEIAHSERQTVSEKKIKIYKELSNDIIGHAEKRMTIEWINDLEEVLNRVNGTKLSLEDYWTELKSQLNLPQFIFYDFNKGLTGISNL
ncbi:MAG: glutamate-cysteine ligase family protein [Candidatus Caenarcaniphilales bacterium]|nr:glutamate-cysteine ligase family protein [Candidatus Caenarcaniphilales bacterium]